MAVHCLGASHPSSTHLVKLLSKSSSEKIYCYSRCLKVNPEHEPFSCLASNISSSDTIISFLPIRVLADLLQKFNIYNLRFHSLIAISSTSVFSKVYAKSKDSLSYLDFLVGEHMLLSRLSLYSQPPFKLVILRPTMLWGCDYDKNISFIHRLFRRFRFFPINSNASGLRRPLHYHQLAYILKSLLVDKMSFPDSALLVKIQGPVSISFFQIVQLVRSTVSGITFNIFIPRSFLEFFYFIIPPNFPGSSAVAMLLRQSDDLIYPEDCPLSSLSPSFPHSYSFFPLIYSEFSSFN